MPLKTEEQIRHDAALKEQEDRLGRERAALDKQKNGFEVFVEQLLTMLSGLFSGITGNTQTSQQQENTPGYQGAASRGAIVGLAERLVGQKESGNNRGSIVRWSNGYEGDAWCGGFANKIYDSICPDLFTQNDFLWANSFATHGKEHNAFRPARLGYTPKPGDTVVFSRDGGGHVGIVKSVENGVVTYISGNYADKVAETSFPLNNPPNDLSGFTDIAALAANKGITLDGSMGVAGNLNSGPVGQHKADAIRRG